MTLFSELTLDWTRMRQTIDDYETKQCQYHHFFHRDHATADLVYTVCDVYKMYAPTETVDFNLQ